MSEINDMGDSNPKPRILCVDDEPEILTSLRRTLRTEGEVLLAHSADEAMQIIKQQSVDIVITDMRMPVKTGADLLREITELGQDPIRVLLTGYSDLELLASAINEGHVNRYLRKPWDNQELISTIHQELERKRLESENQRLGSEVERQNEELRLLNQELTELNTSLEEKVKERTHELRKSYAQLKESHRSLDEARRSTTRIFYNLINLASAQAGKAALITGKLSALIAMEMLLEKEHVGQIRLAGILSELGLLVMNSRFRDIAWYDLKHEDKDTYIGHAILASQAMTPAIHLHEASMAIRHQFEHFDGTGFPEKLANEEIPLGARILSVARDYIKCMNGVLQKGKRSSYSAFEELERAAGHHYDPKVLEALNRAIPLLNTEFEQDDEQVLSTTQIRPGMVLSRDLFNKRSILLLPHDNRLTEIAIERLIQIEEADEAFLEIYVYKNKGASVQQHTQRAGG